MKLTTALLVSLFYFIPAVGAKLGVCDLLLGSQKPDYAFEFQVSDLETLYLELLQDSVRISNGDEKYVKDHAENYMKKKAEFLNDAMPVVRRLRQLSKLRTKARKELNLIYTMISTLGANVKGIQSITKTYRPKKSAVATSFAKPNSIGFFENKNDDGSGPAPYFGFGNRPRNTGSDLPEGMHRSIGFGPQVIESHVETPLRAAGKLTIELTKDLNSIVVTDLMTNTIYMVKKMFMLAGDAESEFKAFAIEYDNGENEWILNYKNLANPEGKIGF